VAECLTRVFLAVVIVGKLVVVDAGVDLDEFLEMSIEQCEARNTCHADLVRELKDTTTARVRL